MFVDGSLTTQQATLPEYLEKPCVEDIVPGTAHWVDLGAISVDGARHVWVDRDADLVPRDDEWFDSTARLIAFDEGIVLDLTRTRDEDGNLHKFRPVISDKEPDAEALGLLPIIEVVTNYGTLQALKDQFRTKYGVGFKGKPAKASREVEPK